MIDENDRFGLWSGRRTREAISPLRQVSVRSIETDKSAFSAFVDIERTRAEVNDKLLLTSLLQYIYIYI